MIAHPQGTPPLAPSAERAAEAMADVPALALISAFSRAVDSAVVPLDELRVYARALEIKRERQIRVWLT